MHYDRRSKTSFLIQEARSLYPYGLTSDGAKIHKIFEFLSLSR